MKCEFCGHEFTPRNKNQKYCSAECRHLFRYSLYYSDIGDYYTNRENYQKRKEREKIKREESAKRGVIVKGTAAEIRAEKRLNEVTVDLFSEAFT